MCRPVLNVLNMIGACLGMSISIQNGRKEKCYFLNHFGGWPTLTTSIGVHIVDKENNNKCACIKQRQFNHNKNSALEIKQKQYKTCFRCHFQPSTILFLIGDNLNHIISFVHSDKKTMYPYPRLLEESIPALKNGLRQRFVAVVSDKSNTVSYHAPLPPLFLTQTTNLHKLSITLSFLNRIFLIFQAIFSYLASVPTFAAFLSLTQTTTFLLKYFLITFSSFS